MHIINNNVAKLLADKMLQGTPTKVIHDHSSTQNGQLSHSIELNNSKTITPHKGKFCNKKAIKNLIQQNNTVKIKLEEAEVKTGKALETDRVKD